MLRFLSMKGKTGNANDFLSVEEAARLIGLSHWTIRLWLRKGILTRYRSAARVLVSCEELRALVEPKKAERA